MILGEKIREYVKEYILDEIGKVDFDKGFSTLEMLLEITLKENRFNKRFGSKLGSIDFSEWDVELGFRLPEFFEKINTIVPDKNRSWEDMKNETERAYRIAFDYTQKFETSDAEKPKVTEDIYGSVFYVYLKECIENEVWIKNAFMDAIDFCGFATKIVEDEKVFFENRFVPLKWKSNDEEKFEFDLKEGVKFLGEPGAGKTTQMKKLYLDEAQEVLKKEGHQVFPIWISCIKLQENRTKIEDAVKEALKEVEHDKYYELLLSGNHISLYIDGFNEIIESSKEMEDYKKELAIEIEKFYGDGRKIRICMTDRDEYRNTACLVAQLTNCMSRGMSQEEMEEYAKKNWDGDAEKLSSVLAYLRADENNWIRGNTMVPEKMNMLLKLIWDGKNPKSDADFYKEYFENIFYREWEIKKESQQKLTLLKILLKSLAGNERMKNSYSEMEDKDIIDLWAPLCTNQVLPTDMLTLAVQMNILTRGGGRDTYKFMYNQYRIYLS